MKKVKRKNDQDSGLLSEPKSEAYFWPLPNSGIHNRIAHLLLLGLGPREIAELLNVSYQPFLKWYLDGGTQRYLMAKRNEEAELKRREAEEKEAAAERQRKLKERFNRC